MKKYLFIVLFIGVCFGQDVYPYFSDPEKQMEYEEKRVYIIEESGKEMHLSGGESYTDIANYVGVFFLGESPQYVVKQTPVETYYRHTYNFKIKRGKKNLNELEFLILAGYESKAKEIHNIYEQTLSPYRASIANYQNQLKHYKNSYKEKVVYGKSFWHSLSNCGSLYFLIALYADDGGFYFDKGIPSYIYYLAYFYYVTYKIPISVPISNVSYPKKPTEPSLEQVLSNEQIKSLAESYNRRLYDEIAKK